MQRISFILLNNGEDLTVYDSGENTYLVTGML